MTREWTFAKKLAGGFITAGLTLLVIAIFGYQSTHRLIENDRWLGHTQQVRRDLAELRGLVTDAETGARGYVIAGNESFLGPYRAAVSKTEQKIEEVRGMISDNPEQLRRLDAVVPLVQSKLALMRTAIEERRTGGVETAAKFIASGEGEAAMDNVRRILAEMDRNEESLLLKRSQEAEASAQTTKAVILWGSLAGAAFVALVAWFITRALTRQIGEAAQGMQSSSTELQASASQQATGAREQAMSMSEIATTISELLATSRQIAESAQRVAQIAEQTATAARSGDGTVLKAQDAILGIRRQVDQIVGHMLELGKKSQQIGAVLDIVFELAEQTNILAINATIEAAGAGEAGKRFAVVADEIRKLADRVTGSTKEIRTLIDDVRSAVNTTVMSTEAGSKAVDTGSKLFGDVATAFKHIASLVGTTTEAAREIELSTKQQATAVEQVNVAIANVAQATRETETSSTQTLQTASQLATLSRNLLQVVQARSAT
jgi:CHASE3 domain sensor protein